MHINYSSLDVLIIIKKWQQHLKNQSLSGIVDALLSFKYGSFKVTPVKKLPAVLLPLAALLHLPMLAFAAGAGTSAAVFLKQNLNPRAAAIGEAFAAVADDAYAIYQNPAGLAYMQQDQVSTYVSKGLTDDLLGQVNYALTYSRELTFGIGLLTYNAGNFEFVDEYGASTKLNAEADYLAALSGAYLLNDQFTVGATVMGLYSRLLEEATAMTVAANLGVDFKPSFTSPLRIGLALRNLGLPVGYGGEKDPLPMNAQLGASYKILMSPDALPAHDLTVAADVNLGLDTPLYANVGAEYWFKKMAAARVGYKFNRDVEGLCAGVGFKYPAFANLPLQLDYALNLAGEFGVTHKLSLSLFLPKNPVRQSENPDEAKAQAEQEAQKRAAVEQTRLKAEAEARAQAEARAKAEAEAKSKAATETPKAAEAEKLPPVTLQVLEIEKIGGEVKSLILNAGSRQKGVKQGLLGIIYNAGHQLAGKCKLVEVYPTRSQAKVLEINADIGSEASVELVNP